MIQNHPGTPSFSFLNRTTFSLLLVSLQLSLLVSLLAISSPPLIMLRPKK